MGEWGPASLSFQDVRVPHSAILGEEGRGFELAMRWIGKGRYLLPARALGSAAYRRVLAEHTYSHRAAEVEAVLEGRVAQGVMS